VRLGVPNYTGDFADLLTTPKYATSLGALYFANEYMLDEISGSDYNKSMDLKYVFGKVKSLFGG
jgi:hypothetical protein